MTIALPTTDRQVSIRHTYPAHANVVLVDWMLGNACSFACSYCPKSLHDGTVRWHKTDQIIALFDALKTHYADRLGRKVWLQFTGGEPTMHPRVVDLLRAASERGLAASLISNGSRTLRFWQSIVDHLDSVILTYHDEFVIHDHFIEIGRLLCAAMPVHVNVTMHPDRFDATFARAEEIGEAMPGATISLKPLREDFDTRLYPYSTEQLKRLETRITRPKPRPAQAPRGVMTATGISGRSEQRRPNSFITHDQNHWRGYRCQAGLESLRVRGDGQIYRAVCSAGGSIGRLGGDVDLPLSGILCDREACSCVADILITKIWEDAARPA